jgi:hypothetical protein
MRKPKTPNRVRSSELVRRKAEYFDWLNENLTLLNRESAQWGVCCERGIAYGKTLAAAVESAMDGDFT